MRFGHSSVYGSIFARDAVGSTKSDKADMRRPHERAYKAEGVPETRSLTVGTAAGGIYAKGFVYIVLGEIKTRVLETKNPLSRSPGYSTG
jgi:hypothetical protein